MEPPAAAYWLPAGEGESRVRTESALNLSRLGKQERRKEQREQSLEHSEGLQPSGRATAMQGPPALQAPPRGRILIGADDRAPSDGN
jgi:hypothetical protein